MFEKDIKKELCAVSEEAAILFDMTKILTYLLEMHKDVEQSGIYSLSVIIEEKTKHIKNSLEKIKKMLGE